MNKKERFVKYLLSNGVNLKFKMKKGSLFMRFLSFVMFWTDFKSVTTTIGRTIYLPYNADSFKDLPYETLVHEGVHAVDYSRSPLGFVLSYTFPQNLAVLSFLSLFAFVSLWYLLFLVFLGFLFVFPAPGRVRLEQRAYDANLAIMLWRRTNIDKKSIWTWYRSKFKSNLYLRCGLGQMAEILERFEFVYDSILLDDDKFVRIEPVVYGYLRETEKR